MEKLLTVKQAAEILGLHPKSIYRLIAQKRLPVVRIAGTRVRVRPSTLENWIRGE